MLYVANSNIILDLYLLLLTALALFNKPASLILVSRLIRKIGGSDALVKLARRTEPLVPTPPPGSNIVTTRDGKPS